MTPADPAARPANVATHLREQSTLPTLREFVVRRPDGAPMVMLRADEQTPRLRELLAAVEAWARETEIPPRLRLVTPDDRPPFAPPPAR